jgi:putative hemolysin
MEIAILFLLILLNGIFAMSEIALVTARKARLQKLIDANDGAAIAAAKLGEDPTRFLSTIQIGITSIGVLNGIVGEAALAPPFSEQLVALGVPQPHAFYAATAMVVVVITYFSIVLGELVPKRLGQSHPELIARIVARPIQWLAVAAKPFVWILTESTKALLRPMGVKDRAGTPVTEEEIHAILAEGTSAGVIETHEHAMVRNVFRLDDRQIGSLMVPRSEIVWLDLDRPLEENLARMERSEHSRFPVCRGGLEEIAGVAEMKQLFNQSLRTGGVDLAADLQPATFVPESLTGMELLDEFRANGTQMVFVVDEYGDVLGLVTLQDVLEAVTGEFVPRNPEDAWAVQRADGSWLIDGLIPIPELKDRLGLKAVPEEERGRYHTLAGMLLLLLGRLPQTGDTSEWEGWSLEIVDMDGKRIDKVLASRAIAPDTPAATQPDSATLNA